MMNDVIMALGENAVLIAVFCGALIAAVLCALILHDNMRRRQQVARMREEYESERNYGRHDTACNSKLRYVSQEDFFRSVARQKLQNDAITAIQRLKRP